MAIYHMQAKVVSRGSGRSAVAASAYMSCSRMYNDYDGIQHDYTRKQGLIYQEVMLPPIAPSKWIDREQLWNAVEETEKTKDSRLAREFVVALPVELDKDSNISLLQDFIKTEYGSIKPKKNIYASKMERKRDLLLLNLKLLRNRDGKSNIAIKLGKRNNI